MACGCGAKAVHKADVGSFLHADYCDDSAVVIANAKAKAKKALKCANVFHLNGVDVPATVTVQYVNHGYWGNDKKHWCNTCCGQNDIMSLNNKGCIVTKAGTDEILRP